MENQLISEHLSSILTKGLDGLLEENRKDDLKLMYSLLGRVKSGHNELKGMFWFQRLMLYENHPFFYRYLNQALFLCAPFLTKKGKCSPFSRAHSHALANAMRRHEYFQGLSRLLPVPGVLVSFLELRFLGKMALLALGGRPQPLKKALSKSKGTFLRENECAK